MFFTKKVDKKGVKTKKYQNLSIKYVTISQKSINFARSNTSVVTTTITNYIILIKI
jgi:hypothetical protein